MPEDTLIPAPEAASATRPALLRYGVAVAATLLAGLLRLSLEEWLKGRMPFPLFVASVLLAAVYGGLGPGLLAVALGGLVGSYLMETDFPWSRFTLDNTLGLAIYLFSALVVVALAEAMRRARQQAEEYALAVSAQRDALQESEERLAVTLRSIGDAVVVTDAQGRVTFLNPVAEQLTGWALAEARGRDSREVFHIVNEATRKEVESPVGRVLRENVVVGLANHTILIRRDGSDVYIDDSGAPIRDNAGNVLGVILVFRDITERRQLEREREEARALLETLVAGAPVGICFLDNEMRFRLVNQPLADMNGMPIERHIGHTVRELLPDVAPTAEALFRQVAESGEPVVDYEVVGETPRAPGERRYWLESWYPVRDGNHGVTGVGVIVQEVTERRRAQEALQRNQEEIKTLNQRLRRAMAETHHRVKNNLQVIAAMVDMQVMSGNRTVPLAEMERLGRHIRSLAVVHDLLTREAKSNGDVEYLHTREALNKLKPLVEGMVGDRSLRFHVEDIRLPIRQGTSLAVLINELVSNAVKHGAGDIDLSLAVVEDQVRLQVQDKGPGFPSGFDPGKAANTGLELIENLGRWDLQGEIAYANAPEGGARVQVTFPLMDERSPAT